MKNLIAKTHKLVVEPVTEYQQTTMQFLNSSLFSFKVKLGLLKIKFG